MEEFKHPMNSYQKVLRTMSIVLLAVASFGVIVGIITCVFGELPISRLGSSVLSLGGYQSSSGATFALGLGLSLYAVLDIVVGVLGYRAANDPRKIMPVIVLCIIGIAIGVLGIASDLAYGYFLYSDLVNSIVLAAFLWVAFNVKKLA